MAPPRAANAAGAGAGAATIPVELFGFLQELRGHNNREWFQANKERYEQQVKGPLLAFIGEFDAHLRTLSAHFVADPRPTGGSLFRIYRDVRFSKDKSPYKTEAGIQFRHERGKDVHAPGFYLHLGLDQSYAAGGLWHPETGQQQQIRAAIDRDQATWRAARRALEQGGFAMGGDTLKRPPRGYQADHPLIDDLGRKDFIMSTPLDVATITAPDFADGLRTAWSHLAPMMRFLTEAVQLPF